MEAKHAILKIPPTLELSANLPEDEREFHGNYEEALEKFFLRSNMSTLTLLPNFQFGGWAAPSGWVATLAPGNSFKQHPLCTEKYNSFIMVRLQAEASSFTPERLAEIQLRETMCLPRSNLNPPTKDCHGNDGWAVALEPRGGAFVGIFKTKTKENDEVKEIFYAIAHVLLPESYIDEQQTREAQLQKIADEFMNSGGSRGKGVSFEREFILDDGGQYQTRAREVGEELGKRLLTDWSRIVDLKLDVMEVEPDQDDEEEENRVEFVIPTEGPDPIPTLLEQALGVWPKGAFLRPYSLIPTEVLQDIPAKLRGYQLGRALGILKKKLPEAFADLQKKFNIRYSDEIVTFIPDCQTMINSFDIMGTNQIVWYNNCTPMHQPFLVFNGLEDGFDCYNYSTATGKSTREDGFRRGPLEAFPVIYPYRRGQRTVSKETILKFCSPEGGGWVKPSFQPSQLRGTFTKPSLQGLTPPANKITLEPVHVFLAGGDFYNVPVYNI